MPTQAQTITLSSTQRTDEYDVTLAGVSIGDISKIGSVWYAHTATESGRNTELFQGRSKKAAVDFLMPENVERRRLAKVRSLVKAAEDAIEEARSAILVVLDERTQSTLERIGNLNGLQSAVHQLGRKVEEHIADLRRKEAAQVNAGLNTERSSSQNAILSLPLSNQRK